MTIHALIDLGQITALECQWERCRESSRVFTPYPVKRLEPGESFNRDKLRIAIDHITPIFYGGSDRPDNLHVVHQTCNQIKSIRREPRSSEVRQAISFGQAQAWADDDGTRRQRLVELNRDEETNAKRAESLRRYYADPENKRRHSDRLKEVRNTPEARLRASEAAKKMWARRREEAADVDRFGGS